MSIASYEETGVKESRWHEQRRRVSIDYLLHHQRSFPVVGDWQVIIHIDENVEENWDGGGMGGMGLSRKTVEPQLPIEIAKPTDARTPRTILTAFQPADDEADVDALAAPGQVIIRAYVMVEYEMSSK